MYLDGINHSINFIKFIFKYALCHLVDKGSVRKDLTGSFFKTTGISMWNATDIPLQISNWPNLDNF